MSDIHNQSNITFLENFGDRYSILSEDNEFKNFKGLLKAESSDLYEYKGNIYTGGHILFEYGIPIQVKYLRNAKKLNITSTVYEPLEVEDTHTYMSNGILHKQCLILDEFAFVDHAREFMKAAFPVISSAQDKKNSKIVIISTPNGMNDFYQIWRKAKAGINDFSWAKIDWRDTPRNMPPEEFRAQEIAKSDAITFEQEYGCCSPDTKVTVKAPDGTIMDITIGELSELLKRDV